MKPEQERVCLLLTDTITLLCKNGLLFTHELKVQGTLGITVDNADVFVVHINERLHGDIQKNYGDTTTDRNAANTGQNKARNSQQYNGRQHTTTTRSQIASPALAVNIGKKFLRNVESDNDNGSFDIEMDETNVSSSHKLDLSSEMMHPYRSSRDDGWSNDVISKEEEEESTNTIRIKLEANSGNNDIEVAENNIAASHSENAGRALNIGDSGMFRTDAELTTDDEKRFDLGSGSELFQPSLDLSAMQKGTTTRVISKPNSRQRMYTSGAGFPFWKSRRDMRMYQNVPSNVLSMSSTGSSRSREREGFLDEHSVRRDDERLNGPAEDCDEDDVYVSGETAVSGWTDSLSTEGMAGSSREVITTSNHRLRPNADLDVGLAYCEAVNNRRRRSSIRKPYACPIEGCERTFYRGSELYRHQREKHGSGWIRTRTRL